MAVEQNLPLRGGGGNHHPLPPTTTSSSSPPVDGRVLLLHFSCRAALPPGSNLRVTGSTLWAPSALTTSPSNPNENDSSAVLPGVSPSAPAASATSQQNDPDEDYNHTGVGGTFGGLHTSSVEMVTSPDMYPVWTTRTPVVVVAASNSNSSNLGGGEGVFRHRYRYLVVTPGADLDHGGAEEENLLRGGSSSTSLSSGGTGGGSSSHGSGGGGVPAEVLSRRGGGGASTTNDKEGSFPVMMWEDPFLEEEERVDALQSTSSLPSIQRAALARRDLVNLPYRTLDLDVSSVNSLTFGKSVNLAAATATARAEEGGGGAGEGGGVEYTLDGVRVDVWNEKGDEAFGPYLEEQESRETPDKDMDTDIFPDEEEDDEDITNEQQDDGGGLTTKSSTTRLWLVCFHLPVILTRNPNTNTWSACWSESLIAKTEQSGVTKLLETRWIGTVSAVPSITSEAERNAVRAVLEPMNCTPLFLDEDVEEAHYMGMCKQVLWPAFHNVDLLDLSTSGWGQREQQQQSHVGQMGAGGAVAQPSSMPTSAPGVPPSPQRQQHPPTSPRPQQQHRQASLSGVVSSSPGSPIRYQYPSAAPPATLGGAPIPPVPTATTNPYMSSGENKSDWDQSRLDGWWKAYQSVNQTFADAIIQNLQPQDTIWVHDYHLLLLPKLLDEAERSTRIDKRRTIKMVFFLHIPFPTSQVFRELQHGEMILEGMLHADVVGFHAFDHARHFLNASKRILGLAYESLMGGLIGVRFRGKKILITMRNVSIEPDIVDGALALPSVKAGANTLKRKHGKRTIVAGVDVAQRLSGISLKLLAYERLLTDYPNWRPLVVMVQKCLISGSRRYDEADTLREVRTLVRRIQDTFGPKVIDYEELVGTSLPIDQRLAIWTSADVLMSTPIREGLNLLPLEYVFARKDPDFSPGVTVASEFSASRSILNGALRVNPYDIPMSAMSIDKALSMDLNEKEARRARDIDFVSSCPSGLWTTNVLRDLHDATAGSYNADMEAVDSPEAMFSRENELSVSPLELDSVVSAYNVTSLRVIIMDFNGTLVMKEPAGKYLKREILGTTGNKPPTAVMAALAALCADKRNTVYVVSGDSQKNLEDALGSIPGLGLAASNGGCFANPPTIQFGGPQQGMYEREWQTFDLGVDWKAVQKVALPILSKYTARTNGSFVKLTHSSIGWSYYSCDPEWGSLQASYLVPELEHELRAYDVRFTTLKGVVEVVPRKLNKGLIVKKVLTESAMRPSSPSSPPQQQPEESGVDFILCVGDDISDEKMFTAVFSFIAESVSPSSQGALALPTVVAPDSSMMDEEPTTTASSWEKNKQQRQMYAFTVAVGKKPTHASRYVEGAGDVANLLISMSGTTELANSGRSMSWETEEMQTDFFE